MPPWIGLRTSSHSWIGRTVITVILREPSAPGVIGGCLCPSPPTHTRKSAHPTSSTCDLRASTGCPPSSPTLLKTAITNVLGVLGGGGTGLNTVVKTAPNKLYTAVAVPGSLCYNVEALADSETPTDAMVSREATTGVEEACDACVEWVHTSYPAPESGFCNPTPSTARE